MAYTALYRKFRPQDFSEVKGQDHIVTTLKNELKAGRIGHAYLFTGTRGTGKTSVAKIFARAVNCENPKEDGSPCGSCPLCSAALSGNSVNVIEMDAASNNGVEDIRTIIDEVSYPPSEGKYKVYIIDEVHMLSTPAFNALLKTLEEPPSYVIFILATTEVHKLPITILSRVQRYDFKRIGIDTVADRITDLLDEEGVTADYKAIRFIAKAADGSMRDALSLLDRCIAFYLGEHLTYEKVLNVLGAADTETFSKLVRCIINHDAGGAIRIVDDIVISGRELSQFTSDLIWYIRNLVLCKGISDLEDIIDMSEDNLKTLREEAEMIEEPVLDRYIRVLSELYNRMRYSGQKRVLLEVTIIKLCRPETEEDFGAIVDRMSRIEERLDSGDIVVSGLTGAAAGGFAGGAGTEGSAAGNGTGAAGIPVKQKLPDAIPEDVEKACREWNAIKHMLHPMRQESLRGVSVSVSQDKELMFVFDLSDQTQKLGYNTFTNQEHFKELNDIIDEHVGAHVPVVLQKNETGKKNTDVYEDAIAFFAARGESVGVPVVTEEE